MQLPKKGLITFKEKIFQMLKDFEKYDINWNDGRLFGYIFDPGKKYRNIVEKALLQYYHKSGLDFTVYPSLLSLKKNRRFCHKVSK
jgi:sphinganine-1-phosphate aldolase